MAAFYNLLVNTMFSLLVKLNFLPGFLPTVCLLSVVRLTPGPLVLCNVTSEQQGSLGNAKCTACGCRVLA